MSEQETLVSKNNKLSDNIVIELSNVTKIYPGGTVGIKNLTLQIQQGEIFGFLGQNGAGKTTCIRCILNILIPNEGTIHVNSKQVSRKNPEIREDIEQTLHQKKEKVPQVAAKSSEEVHLETRQKAKEGEIINNEST